MVKRVTGDGPKYRSILAFGEGGSGKTDAINHLAEDGKVLMLCFELRTEALDDNIKNGNIVCLEMENMADFSEQFNRLRKAKSGGETVYDGDDYSEFKYLAIDTISDMSALALKEEQAINSHGQAAYGEMASRIDRILGLIDKLPMHIYVTGKVDRVNQDGEFVFTIKAEGNKLKTTLGHFFSVICAMPKFEKLSKKTILTSMTSNYPEVKDHSKRLDLTEPYDLAALFKKSIEGEKIR